MAGSAVALAEIQIGFEQAPTPRPALRFIKGGLLEASQEIQFVDQQPISIYEDETKITEEERCLTEVNHLLKNRRADGSYPEDVIEGIKLNKKTALEEVSMPFRVSEHESDIEYDGRRRITRWMGQTAVESAMTGYVYHHHPSALKRVDLEVDEAHYMENDLRPGTIKFYISPRMTENDAPREVAKHEHLANEDSVRADWIEEDSANGPGKHKKQSLLFRNIPLKAWVDMLADPANPFGKSIVVEDEQSALSVKKAHRQLEVAVDESIKGPLDLVRFAINYIENPETKQKAMAELALFDTDQARLDKISDNLSSNWVEFDMQIADSYKTGKMSNELVRFMASFDDEWSDRARAVINRHKTANGYQMSKEMAVVLASAKAKTIWTRGALEAGNKEVIDQFSSAQIQSYQRLNQTLVSAQTEQDYARAYQAMDSMFARVNAKISGGCPGAGIDMFGNPITTTDNVFGQHEAKTDSKGRRDFDCPTCGKINHRDHEELLKKCKHCSSDKVSCE